jgi:hypothetical protein
MMIVVGALGFLAGFGLAAGCVVWAAFVAATGNIFPHFGFGVEHPGEE